MAAMILFGVGNLMFWPRAGKVPTPEGFVSDTANNERIGLISTCT